jgi:imidazole glycerol-phosphate synthase subunit HisF
MPMPASGPGQPRGLASSGRPGLAPRIIPRLDIKAPNLVKGIHLEGLRVVGDPAEHAVRYYQEGADELLYVDIVASLYERNSLLGLVERTAASIFVPLTVAGGIRSVEDIHRLLRAGADKVAINTAAIRRPELLTEASRVFGSQCIVLSVEAKRIAPGKWEAFTDNGRERTGRDVVEWIREGVDRGAGEILLTSVDAEGTRKGFDLPLIDAIGRHTRVPVVASGGAGSAHHVQQAFERGADGVAVASLFHHKMLGPHGLKEALAAAGLSVVL